MSRYYNGTSAYKIDDIGYVNNSSAKESIEKRQIARENKRALFVKRLRVCLGALGIFAIAFSILFVNAVIIEKSSLANEMQAELQGITEKNNHMKLEIEKNLDLNRIEDIAINELGMKRPDKYQVVYVHVEQNDYAEVVQNDSFGSGFSAKLGAIGSGIGRFMEYIN